MPNHRIEKLTSLGVITAIALGLYLSSLYSYLLFHSLIELATIAIGFTLFIFAWNARRFLGNDFLGILGIGYACISFIDLLHTLAYKGMEVFPGFGSNLPAQLWIAARFLQAVTLCLAPFFVARRTDHRAIFGGAALAVSMLVALIFSGHFPDCYSEGQGLTPFKIISEYAISAMLLASLYLFSRKRRFFSARVFTLIASSILCTAFSELAFTAYLSVYGLANMAGHFLKLAAFYLIYRAIVVTGVKDPFDLIFRELAQAKESIRQARDTLEESVRERTAELRASESKLAEAQSIAHIGHWDRDLDAGRISLSDEACRIFGFPPYERILSLPEWHQRWLELIHPEDRPRTEKALADALGNGPPYNLEYRVIRPNGEVRIVHSYAEVTRDDSGRPQRIFGTMQDITERKQAEEALRQSEMRYRLIVDTANEGIWMLGPEARTTFVNDRMAAMIGYPAEEMTGKPLADFLVEEERPAHGQRMEGRRRGISENYECRFRHRDGSTVWALASAVPVFDDTRSFQGSFAMFTDITERKQAEEALIISETELKEAQRIAHIGHWEWNIETDSIVCSEELCRLFSHETAFSPPDFLKHPGLYTLESAERLRQAVQKAMASGAPYELDLELARPSAATRWIVARGEAKRDASGRVLALRGTAQNITERKKSEETIRKLNEELEQRVTSRTVELQKKSQQLLNSRQALMNLVDDLNDKTTELEVAKVAAETANRAKSIFLANMSHELRTPLNAILGFAQLLERSPDLGEEQRENLAIIIRSGEHLLGLINDVLEIAKIEAGHTPLHTAPFDLYRLLQGIGEMFAARAESGGLFFHSELDPLLPRYVDGDSGKLRQVLINLLGNAVKFTREGGLRLKVRSSNAPAADPPALSLHFEVEDSGIGIAAEKIGMIFEPFIQAGSSKDQSAGTGLGLTISRHFVELMGGTITVRSTFAQGSVFAFDIPVRPVDQATTIGEARTPTRVTGLAPGTRDYRILIVEDREENRLLLRRLLESVGFTVREAVNGSEGLALFDSWQPDFVWMDIRMPVMDGLEATRRIKATARGAQTPVVALTASAFEEQRENILGAGCDDFVRKPFKDEEIWRVMAKHLGVRFLYEVEQHPPPSLLTPLPTDTLALLDRNLLGDLARATLACEREACLALIGRIAPEQDSTAQALRRYILQHKFDKLYGMLEDYLSASPAGNDAGL